MPTPSSPASTRAGWVAVFVLMGLLCGLASIVVTARLNAGASVTGTMTELNVIAAAVIGGTSLAGGVGTIYGAILGALIMQSLESGMILMGIPTPLQKMVLAVVLIRAVWIDMAYRREPARVTPLVEFRNITKTFGGVHAVENVSLDLAPGEVLGLLGHNGAGKSTLIKILSGVFTADSGEIRVAGAGRQSVRTATRKPLGIETIYQNLALSENLDSVANVFLGRELTDRFGFMNDEAMEEPPALTLQRMKLRLPSSLQPGREPLRRAAAGDRHRAGRPFQRARPDHGRADRRARAGGDRRSVR